ncbi:MAG: DNA replication and repair protein RecF, partial [Eggerthellaceae bacterium]|nr:DNA replication and repair protein RecF [Eggerthellaceae bacterium]
SIIEAIQLMTELKSFRATSADQLIQWGKDNSVVKMQVSDGSRFIEEELHIQEGKRKYYLNQKSKKIQDLKGFLPAVVFTPDDLNLIKGSNSKRRDSIDSLGVQLSKNFYVVRSDYQKLIKQKNQALKDGISSSVIESINEVLAKVGAQYIHHRLTLLDIFVPYLESFYSSISNEKEKLQLRYEPSFSEEVFSSWPCSALVNKDEIQEKLFTSLIAVLPDEIDSKRSKVGPHADKLNFNISLDSDTFNNAEYYASQGQQRSIVLAFKMAELQTIQNRLHQRPVLLLDDVMSELDEKRRLQFMELIGEDIQTFITTTNLSYFSDDIIKGARIYNLPLENNNEAI